MNSNDFAKYLTDFLSSYLPRQKNVSKNTIYAYRDTFKLLLRYCQEQRGIKIERITLSSLNVELIKGFLNWLEDGRKCSISTRNQRLASIHSFFRYVQSEDPAGLYHFQQIISIPAKKTQQKVVDYLSPEVIQIILEQPNKTTAKGRRNLTLLSVLYDTGARVQELIDIKLCDIQLDFPPVIILSGKGNKTRRVPLMKNTTSLLQTYILENSLDEKWKNQYPLFTNNQRRKLTKEGVAYILKKYVVMAKSISPKVPERVYPHLLRHSKAMHLLQAGVNLIYIRDFLGHVDIKTTEIYAKADTETKRIAIENACPDIINGEMPDWNKDTKLLSWLSSLK
ncbi:site-specific integrase [Candidatus Uabimicrobium sp. HlEnr_7]|uniref:site-specific integrase n=1 Tax=Candidatus Uabimicrobium helgolandensis TaxID=3095367 RepID=UPI003555DA20